MLFRQSSHADNNVVTTLFSHHCCNHRGHGCNTKFLPVNFQQPWTTLLLHHCSAIIVEKQCWTTLFIQQCCSCMMTMLFRQQLWNNFMGDFYAGVLYTFTTGNAILRTAFPVFLIEILHSRSATLLEIHKGQLATIWRPYTRNLRLYYCMCLQ